MPSLPHLGGFNIEACRACGEKRLSHTETGAEKQCNSKIQRNPQTVLWKIKTRHTPHEEKNAVTNRDLTSYTLKEKLMKGFHAESIGANDSLQASFEWRDVGILSISNFLDTPLSKSKRSILCLHLVSLQPYSSKLGLLWFAVRTSLVDLQFSQRIART